MKKKLIFDGQFEQGRPFSIIVFCDIRFNTHFILINIHAGHNYQTITSIFEPIQKLIEINKISINKYDIKRIIIIGDFNRNISSQIVLEPKKYKLIVNLSKYYFKSLENTNKTCCSLNGWGYKNNYDQIIDSYATPMHMQQLNKEQWYISNSSDHLAILTIVKNL